MGCAPGDEAILKGWDRLSGLGGIFQVVKCSSCGLMRTNPRPVPETIGVYYPGTYGPFHTTQINRKLTLKKRFLKLLGVDLPRLPVSPPGRILDVGCASGSFMGQMRERGWTPEGIETDSGAAAAAQAAGFPVHVGSLENAPDRPGEYDLVWMSHVLEHLHEPVKGLRRLHGWTKPGGWLVCAVPDAGALEFRVFRDAWYALQLPTHLFHFIEKTLKAVMLSAGWQVTRISRQPTLNNLIGSIGYVVGDRMGRESGLARYLLRYPDRNTPLRDLELPLALVAAALGQTGRMQVWARKV